MVEVADIFRRYGPSYRQKFGSGMPPRHRQAMADIEQCRTERFGGHVFSCDTCHEIRYSYHSCKNRHCPKCQNETAEQWLLKQQALLLPVPHFLVTFTLPAELRPLVRRHQKTLYNVLFRVSAAALQQLAADPRFVGGHIGMVGVLHTWTRDLNYHPHIHYLVPAGALAPDGQQWHPSRSAFLVHVRPLSILFRAKFREALKMTPWFDEIPAETWTKPWVVHCKAVGSGEAALKYLAPYVFRVALSNNRLVKVADDRITFRYQDSKTRKTRYCTLAAEEFIRRFLQHVLPKGLVKVRYYGLFSPGHRPRLTQARQLLQVYWLDPPSVNGSSPAKPMTEVASLTIPPKPSLSCPKCGHPMRLIETLKASRCRSP